MLLVALSACTGPSDVVTPPPSTTDTFPWSTIVPPPEGDPALYFAGERPKNVLMISIDTTRRDQFGPWSVDGDHTPFLRALAESGFRLSDHQQCSDWTYASTSCTLSGRYHEENGFVPRLSLPITDPANQYPAGAQTLAQRLQDQGYYTILVSGNGWLSANDNNAQGYVEAPLPSTGNCTKLFEDGTARLQAARAAGLADRWMLHVHLLEPHPPYNPPVEYLDEEAALDPLPDTVDLSSQDGQYAATATWPVLSDEEQALLEAHLWARYHGELRYLDDQIAAFWPQLESAGLLDDTLVVVWTDHGEQMWEHGNQSHAYFLAAEENDGVLFFWAKNLPSVDWTRPTHAVDLVPTVLDAVGHPADPYDPLLSGYTLGTAPDDRPRFAMSVARLGPEQSVTLDGWKLTYNFSGAIHLMDRNTDRYELVDVLAENPDDPHVLPLWSLLAPRAQRLSELLPENTIVWPEGLPVP